LRFPRKRRRSLRNDLSRFVFVFLRLKKNGDEDEEGEHQMNAEPRFRVAMLSGEEPKEQCPSGPDWFSNHQGGGGEKRVWWVGEQTQPNAAEPPIFWG